MNWTLFVEGRYDVALVGWLATGEVDEDGHLGIPRDYPLPFGRILVTGSPRGRSQMLPHRTRPPFAPSFRRTLWIVSTSFGTRSFSQQLNTSWQHSRFESS